ncbi:radical SAM family heme chaperone HemW [Collinsella provencensis]|uniref:radical SAM family heme chaperone HemW n=1 Tax=Collinsella provencensis TaxID=1937461 RepID=UPI000C8305D6|nr:radical SAM family heme chaperone HemW [Collinsella provencensis]
MNETSYQALYLHIPFCRSKCAYCDFDSRAFAPCELDAALDAYCVQLEGLLDKHGKAGELDQVATVYIGGGTPSIMGERLPRLVRRVCAYCNPVEFTCEANPESFTPRQARELRDAGVTRISLGIQSLNAVELKILGRIHSAEEALEALELAKRNGFSTSCDLMCALPGQTYESWRTTLARIIAAAPDHVSVYPLQVEGGTPLARLEEAGKIDIPDEDFQALCMEEAAKQLRAAGYARYEVASYAKPGHRCQHNIAYWTGKPYLGLGRSASSMRHVASERTNDVSEDGAHRPFVRERFTQLDDAGTRFDREILMPREAYAEDLMLACRMTDGIPRNLLERAEAYIPSAELKAACARAVALELATWRNELLCPTQQGWLCGNELYGLFWDLAE